MRIAIGIATRGRPAILAETLSELRRQRRAPDRVIVCHVGPEDLPAPGPCRGSATPSSTPPPPTATWCCSWTTTSSPPPTTSR